MKVAIETVHPGLNRFGAPAASGRTYICICSYINFIGSEHPLGFSRVAFFRC